MQEFVIKEEFQTHIKKDGHDLEGIEGKLRFRRNDVMKTECPIVIAGEQSYIIYNDQINNISRIFI